MLAVVPPFQTHSLSGITFLDYGDTVLLPCPVAGSPPLSYLWCHWKRQTSQCMLSKSSELLLHNISREDEGHWICVSSNEVGEVSVRLNIYKHSSYGNFKLVHLLSLDKLNYSPSSKLQSSCVYSSTAVDQAGSHWRLVCGSMSSKWTADSHS